jgi:purine-binding chemotaxis protein CheW
MTDTQADTKPLQCVTFSLDGETYGINVMQVQEVLRETEVAPVPGAPAYVLGIINLRGNVVTVIDARLRFGLQPKPSDDLTRVIVIEVRRQIVGILVDSVAEVVDVDRSSIDSAPSAGTAETAKYIQGVVNRASDLLILIDLNKLLTEVEVQKVVDNQA